MAQVNVSTCAACFISVFLCGKEIVLSQIRNADFSGGMRGRHCALTGIAIEGRNSRHPAVSRRLSDGMAI